MLEEIRYKRDRINGPANGPQSWDDGAPAAAKQRRKAYASEGLRPADDAAMT
jgi:hypothetical protein